MVKANDPKVISGLIVIVFALIGSAAFYPYYIGTDRCQSDGEYGTWEAVTELVWFDDEFPAIGRYYCSIETNLTAEECLYSEKLLNYDGCKWGGKTSKSKKTLYVMEDPPLEEELEKGWKVLTEDVKFKETELCAVTFFNKTSYSKVNCTNITYYYNCTSNESNCTEYNWTNEEWDPLITITEHNKTSCKDISFGINLTSKEYIMNFTDFGNCSYALDSKNNTKVKVICDSYYDSNLDGICQSGESCCVYYCDNDDCDFDDLNCDINSYIERLQKKEDKNKVKITEVISQ